MKVKTFLTALPALVFAQLAMSGTLSAQNFIKKVAMEGGPSIIRTIDNTHWLTYCENSKGRKDFYIVPQSGTVIDNMQIKDQTIHVTDFVINADTVYFCGKKDTDTPLSRIRDTFARYIVGAGQPVRGLGTRLRLHRAPRVSV